MEIILKKEKNWRGEYQISLMEIPTRKEVYHNYTSD